MSSADYEKLKELKTAQGSSYHE